MTITADTPEQELDLSTATAAPVRHDYSPRTPLIARAAAGVLALPFVAALAMRSTGAFAVVALLLAVAAGWLLFHIERRLAARAPTLLTDAEGVTPGGSTRLDWADITTVEHSLARGQVRFGTRTNPHALSIDADLRGYRGFLGAAVAGIDAARRAADPPRGNAGALFPRPAIDLRIMLVASLASVLLGLVVAPGWLFAGTIALPLLIWRWITGRHSVAVDDTAVWIIRPLHREAIPLRAIRDVELVLHGRLLRPAVVIDCRDRSPVVITIGGTACLPLYDAIAAARARATAAARTGPAASRTGSAIRHAGSRADALRSAGRVAAAFIAIVWITVLTGVPIRTAARHGNEPVARAALLLRSPVNLRGRDGRTALHEAAQQGSTGLTRMLLARGAAAAAATSGARLTPLHLAAQHGHASIVQMLVEAGADVAATTTSGHTPLAQLALAGASADSSIASFLLSAGSDPAASDDMGRNALHHAAANGRTALIRRIARNTPAINAPDVVGDRPLHAAVRAGHQAAAAALVAARADVNAAGQSARTPVAVAAAAGASVALVNLLLDGGARPNRPDGDGWNAVQLAAAAGNIELLELFARRRAPLDATDGRIAPALWLATESGNTAAARALLRGGASPYVRWDGRSAIELARAQRNATLVALMQMR